MTTISFNVEFYSQHAGIYKYWPVAAVLIAVLIVNYYIWSRKRSAGAAKAAGRPSISKKPKNTVANNNLVVVENTSMRQLQSAVKDFCSLYNEKEWNVIADIYSLDATTYFIRFPYNISFTLVTYLINYLDNPVGIRWEARSKGYSTLPKVMKPLGGLEVVIFPDRGNRERDSVLITTKENKTYRFDFGGHYEIAEVSLPFETAPCPHVTGEPVRVE